jgi:hypothetical protein
MLQDLPSDILALIFARVDDPEDFKNALLSCKHVHEYITKHNSDITLQVEYSAPIHFLRQMKGLRTVSVFRTYDIVLDFSFFPKYNNLTYIFVNSPDNVIRVPRHVTMLHAFDDLSCSANLYHSDEEADDDDDEFSGITSAIEYFNMRYKTKKYTKITYKNSTFQMKTKFFVSSI